MRCDGRHTPGINRRIFVPASSKRNVSRNKTFTGLSHSPVMLDSTRGIQGDGAAMQESTPQSEHLSELIIDAEGVTPDRPVSQVAELFLGNTYAKLLSLPVLEGGRPVGVISRERMQQVLFKPYGREIFGKKPNTAVTNDA